MKWIYKIINSYRYERDSKLKKDIKMIWKNTNDYKKCPNYKYGCNTKLWKNNKEEYYIEVHHINPLSENGEDIISNLIPICPNCHRKAHYASEKIKEKMKNNFLGIKNDWKIIK